MITFTVSGKPQVKQRPRVKKNGFTYTPKETLLYEELVLQTAKESGLMPSTPLTTPLKMILWCYIPIPVSWSKKKQAEAKSGKLYPITQNTGDIDNFAKIIMDALSGEAYQDDSQIVELVINKRYGEKPMMDVLIDEI